MRIFASCLALVLASCGGVTVGLAHPATADTGPVMTDLAWLLGSWESAPDEHGCTFHEEWRRESDALYTGHGSETCTAAMDERQPFDEDLRLEAEARGLVYVAWPTGQERTEFDLSSGSATGFVAENPEHDFPTRIEYRHTDGSIVAIVSGSGRTNTLTMHPVTSDAATTE